MEEVDESEWQEKEQFYISQQKDRGVALLNATNGGRSFSDKTYAHSYEATRKPIIQYDLEGKFIKEWKSIREAARETNTPKSSIYYSLNTTHQTANNFYWRKQINKETPMFIYPAKRTFTDKPIIQILPNGDEIKWKSIKEAAQKLNINRVEISKMMKSGTSELFHGTFKKDLSSNRWKRPFGKLNQKQVNYMRVDTDEYTQFGSTA